MTYLVEVLDPPDHPLARPLTFRLGPFQTREEAERMALRAKATNARATTRVVEQE